MNRWTTAVLATLSLVFAASAQSVRIVEETDGGFQLLVNGEPFFIKGAGGDSELELLAESGGNSIRTWGVENGREVLDRAHEQGLMVTMGIWLQHPRHGFDYTDRAAVMRQREEVRRAVIELRDHPALLMWGLGNEVELESDPRLVFPEIDEIAKIVGELDPNRPKMTVIAEPKRDKIDAFLELCPNIDVIGVNAYGSAHEIPGNLREAGYDGPYIVTEFGPRGWWESAKADWGAPIEQTSAEKSEEYRYGYEQAVLGSGGRCIGSYVFLWGQKQEATETWFGMFLKDGGRTPTADVMREMWTGEAPPNHAPIVSGIESEAGMSRVAPGSVITAAAIANDKDGDKIEYEWVIIEESTDRRSGGDAEAAPPRRPELTIRNGGRIGRMRAPREAGAYRIFVFARDAYGGAGTANIPFYVE